MAQCRASIRAKRTFTAITYLNNLVALKLECPPGFLLIIARELAMPYHSFLAVILGSVCHCVRQAWTAAT